MIETEKSVAIRTDIDRVWDYVRDIRRWAELFPGCRDCTVIDEDRSRWVIKVGTGGMVRTVNVLVHVEQWDGPGRVNFSYVLDGDPAGGSGAYIATSKGPEETEVTLRVRVEGSGSTAGMWETMSKPLLPQLAKTFSGRLKEAIEKAAGVTDSPEPEASRAWFFAGLFARLRRVWRRLFRSKA